LILIFLTIAVGSVEARFGRGNITVAA